MRSNSRNRRVYTPARIKLALLLTFLTALALSLIGLSFRDIQSAQAASANLVVSQVYGGAGCTTAAGCSTYGNDFIEP